MKIVFKTLIPLHLQRILLFLLLSLISAYFYMRQTPSGSATTTFMIVSPIVPNLDLVHSVQAPLVKDVTIARNQTFSELMEDQGFSRETILEICESAKSVYNLAQIHVGKNLVLTSSPDNELTKLEYQIDPLQTLIVTKSEAGWEPEIISKTPETLVQELGSSIEGSLYSTMNRLNEDDELVARFADIFEWDVDFFKDLQLGDTFRIVYERTYLEGQPYSYGKILAAELTNKGKTYTAIGYQRGKNWEYFSPDGKAMKKAFLASPIKFSRISSGFTSRRYHPVLKGYRPHYGIDYAAPHGTPVRAIGSGRVILAGWAGGAGKTVKISHNGDISTVYCHLSRFAAGVRVGSSVSQGQVIGYVGSTGLATGPHLDFRYIKNGKYLNFLRIKTPQDEPLSVSEIAKFRAQSSDIVQQLANVRIEDGRPAVAAIQQPPANPAR